MRIDVTFGLNNQSIPVRMSDKIKVVQASSGYTLPEATPDTLGGIKVGSGLKIADGTLSVDTADAAQPDNTQPITSAAVYTQIGNIEVLLAQI